jgi:holin-like protein
MQTIDGGGAPAPSDEAAVTPQGFIAALTLFLVCQLAGETLVRSLGVALPHFAFPGPVAGMVILFGLLAWRGRIGPAVAVASNGILRNLSLLFVPAAVGIVQYGGVITEFGVALIAALVLSTVATLIVTVVVFVAVARRTGAGNENAA